MSDLRHDAILDRTVYIAERRGERPNDYRTISQQHGHATSGTSSADSCPFCVGNENQTPPPVYEKRDEQGNWQVRVVPNKYPFVTDESDHRVNGIHEVIVESSRHVARSGELSVQQLAVVFQAYRQRLCHWHADGRFRYAVLFKNSGPMAGASLVHLHSQFVVLPEIPQKISRELKQLRRHYQATGSCPFCQRLAEERAASQRVVLDRDGLVAFCPYASLHPYEIWVTPAAHEPALEESRLATALPGFFLDVIRRVEQVAAVAGYNVLLFTAPWADDGKERHHWRIEIRPRPGQLAGFELATGIFINHVAPERAAKQLRDSA